MLSDLVIEAQNKFDQLEMMLSGLLAENQVDSCFLDEDTVLASIDSMILQAELLEEQRRIKVEKDQPNVESRIQKYTEEFKVLHKQKQDLNRQLMNVQELSIPAIMVHIRSQKKELLKQALTSCARIVSSLQSVTKEEIDRIFEKSLIRTCKLSVSKFIRSFV